MVKQCALLVENNIMGWKCELTTAVATSLSPLLRSLISYSKDNMLLRVGCYSIERSQQIDQHSLRYAETPRKTSNFPVVLESIFNLLRK